jgi:Arc/MetJ-type ribon-helix-helix transcriptional regulator
MAVEGRRAGVRVQRRRSYGRRGVHGSVHTKKVTVTIPEDLLEAAIAQVEAGQAPSLSAYVSDALAKKVAADGEGDPFLALLDEWDREVGPPSEEDFAWARRALGLEEETSDQSPSTPGH